jgi:hypothetical protein
MTGVAVVAGSVGLIAYGVYLIAAGHSAGWIAVVCGALMSYEHRTESKE